MDAKQRAIIHIDMDAFYAAVEQRDNPELQGKPVIIGGSVESRGVVSTASYEARTYGVHSAMPMAEAHRLCPNGIYLPVDMQKYRRVSQQIMGIFHRFTPEVEAISLDEAFLDVTASQRLFGTAEEIGYAIKGLIKTELHLTASVGLSYNKFLAKLASDMDKPDGFYKIAPEELEAKVWEKRIPQLSEEEKLAVEFDRLWFDYDRILYDDSVRSMTENVEELSQEIKTEGTERISDILREIVIEGVVLEEVERAKELLDKLSEYKPLAKVEEVEEQNYNMIDNVLNNGAEKAKKEADRNEMDKPRGRVSLKERLAEKKAIIAGNDKVAEAQENVKRNQREM